MLHPIPSALCGAGFNVAAAAGLIEPRLIEAYKGRPKPIEAPPPAPKDQPKPDAPKDGSKPPPPEKTA